MAFPLLAPVFPHRKISLRGQRGEEPRLKRIKLKGAVEFLGVVFALEKGAAQAALAFLTEGQNGPAGADGAGQRSTTIARTGEGRAGFFLFSAVVKIPAVHGNDPWAARSDKGPIGAADRDVGRNCIISLGESRGNTE